MDSFERADFIPADMKLVPILGTAVVGRPYEYPIPKSLYRTGTVVYQVQGDSMDDGSKRAIPDGSFVLVDPSLTELMPGKLYVLEIIGDGYTLKEARRMNGGWILVPWNPAHPILRLEGVRVVGQVYSVVQYRTTREL